METEAARLIAAGLAVAPCRGAVGLECCFQELSIAWLEIRQCQVNLEQ